MQLRLSQITRNAIVDVIANLIDSTRNPGRIELLSADRRVIARLMLSKPCAADGVNGVLRFYDIREDPAASITGAAIAARILDGNGNEILTCDVTGKDGDGVIRLNSNQIVAGGPVRISEFLITMPDE